MIEEMVKAALSDGSPDLRVYADEAPQEATSPLVVFTIIGGHDEMHLRGDSNLRRRLIQIDVWANSRLMASNLMEGVRTKMLGAASYGFEVGSIDETAAPRYDTETKQYRSSYEFGVWFNG